MVDTPGGDDYRLKRYWLVGPGLAKWTTWTELFHHLKKYMIDELAKRCASQWFHDRYGYWPGDSRNR